VTTVTFIHRENVDCPLSWQHWPYCIVTTLTQIFCNKSAHSTQRERSHFCNVTTLFPLESEKGFFCTVTTVTILYGDHAEWSEPLIGLEQWNLLYCHNSDPPVPWQRFSTALPPGDHNIWYPCTVETLLTCTPYMTTHMHSFTETLCLTAITLRTGTPVGSLYVLPTAFPHRDKYPRAVLYRDKTIHLHSYTVTTLSMLLHGDDTTHLHTLNPALLASSFIRQIQLYFLHIILFKIIKRKYFI
jgi:hypothetical protein